MHIKNKNIDILLDLITTCYKNNWIPIGYKKKIKRIYQNFCFLFLTKKNIDIKKKAYFFIYLFI